MPCLLIQHLTQAITAMKKKINVFVQAEGRDEPVVVQVPENGTVLDVLSGAQAAGLVPDLSTEAAVFLQDDDDELDDSISILEAGIAEKTAADAAYGQGKTLVEAVSLAAETSKIVKPSRDGMDAIDRAIAGIQHNDFSPSPSPYRCPRCPYYFICPSAGVAPESKSSLHAESYT